MIELETFRTAMTRLPSAVTIITTGEGDRRRGLTATAVCSLSADPPSILACVNAGAEAHDFIVAEQRFAVNILGARQAQLAEVFAGKDGRKGLVRFDHGEWKTGATGAPILVGAAAVFDCRLARRFDGYSHSIFVGEVEGVHVGQPDLSSLLWYRRLFHLVPPASAVKTAGFKDDAHTHNEVIYGW